MAYLVKDEKHTAAKAVCHHQECHQHDLGGFPCGGLIISGHAHAHVGIPASVLHCKVRHTSAACIAWAKRFSGMPAPCPCCFVDNCFRKYTPTKAPKPISTILRAANAFDWAAMPYQAFLQALIVLRRSLVSLLCLVIACGNKYIYFIHQATEHNRDLHKCRGNSLWGDSQQVSHPFADSDKHARHALGYSRAFPRTQGCCCGSHLVRVVVCG